MMSNEFDKGYMFALRVIYDAIVDKSKMTLIDLKKSIGERIVAMEFNFNSVDETHLNHGYHILKDTNLLNLERRVIDFMKQGWRPLSSPFYKKSKIDNANVIEWFQAVIKN